MRTSSRRMVSSQSSESLSQRVEPTTSKSVKRVGGGRGGGSKRGAKVSNRGRGAGARGGTGASARGGNGASGRGGTGARGRGRTGAGAQDPIQVDDGIGS